MAVGPGEWGPGQLIHNQNGLIQQMGSGRWALGVLQYSSSNEGTSSSSSFLIAIIRRLQPTSHKRAHAHTSSLVSKTCSLLFSKTLGSVARLSNSCSVQFWIKRNKGEKIITMMIVRVHKSKRCTIYASLNNWYLPWLVWTTKSQKRNELWLSVVLLSLLWRAFRVYTPMPGRLSSDWTASIQQTPSSDSTPFWLYSSRHMRRSLRFNLMIIYKVIEGIHIITIIHPSLLLCNTR